MKLNIDAVQSLLRSRGWTEQTFSSRLGLDYSYIYRIMRGQMGTGPKFLSRLITFCAEEGLEFKDFVILPGRKR